VSDDGAHVVIRPLVFVGEDEARAYTKEQDLPVIGCCCPACGDLGLQRQRAKRLLMEMEREHPGVKQSMIKALANVAPRHLLDTRLNPPADLVRRTGEPRPAPAAAAPRARTIKVRPAETVQRGDRQSSAISATSALIVGDAASSSE
jgi:tRNA(Ile)-lysidine synthase TilS/MesJ